MRVKILSKTENPERVIALAARQCYFKGSVLALEEDPAWVDVMDSEEVEKLIKRLLTNGHLSPFEHASITFAVEGISRACSHQLVRHRLASYSQQSQRYVKMNKEPDWVIPPSISPGSPDYDVYHKYRHGLWCAWNAYREMVRDGCPPEDARYLLPNATPTNIVMTMNFRELLHFFEERCCKRAQWEIRNLANEMLSLSKSLAPTIFADAGARCSTCQQDCPGN